MRMGICLGALLLLAGCQSGTADYQQVFNECSQNGTSKNTDQINACINYRLASQQAAIDSRRAGLASASAILLSQNQPPRRALSCTTTTNGPFTNTNCY